MKTELDKIEPGKMAVVEPTQETAMISMIERMAMSPDVDVDKLERLMVMQEKMLDREAEQEYNKAMVRAQMLMPIVPEDADNQQTRSTYSKYKTVLKYTKPIYTAEGFSVSFYEGDGAPEGEIRVMADIMHRSGFTKTRHVDVPLDKAGIKGTVNKTGPHAKGSSLSYGKGYLMKMIFNIPTGDDDDGNAAGKNIERITEDQAKIIHAMITDNDINMDRFMATLKSGFMIENIDNIRADNYERVVSRINATIDAKREAK